MILASKISIGKNREVERGVQEDPNGKTRLVAYIKRRCLYLLCMPFLNHYSPSLLLEG